MHRYKRLSQDDRASGLSELVCIAAYHTQLPGKHTLSDSSPVIPRTLHRMWNASFARLANPNIAAPAAISLAESGRQPLRYIWVAILASARGSTVAMIAATTLGTLSNVGQSYLLGQVTERAITSHKEQVTELLVWLMALWVLAPLAQGLFSLARLYANQNLRIVVTDHLAARLMYVRPAAITDKSVGDLVERIELASANLPSIVCSSSDTVVKLVSVVVFASFVMASVSPVVALFASLWMLTAILLSGYLAFTGMQIAENAGHAHAVVIAHLVEAITNLPLVRSFATQATERKRFGKSLENDLVACRKIRSYWVFVHLIETVYKWVFGIAVVCYAISGYNAGTLLLPQLVTLCALIIALSWHFESVAFHFVDLFEALGTLDAGLKELSSLEVELDANIQPLPCPGRIYLSNVLASYGGENVLHDITLQIEPGQKVGIVGPSGSGKSTLLGVLRGQVHAHTGAVELHGVRQSECSIKTLTLNSSEALQSALMFNRSVRHNINYGSALATTAEIERALQAAQAQTMVLALPDQLDCLVGEQGTSLSTGERQRLSIARALMKSAALLIFDEATASVDTVSESKIIDHIVENMPERTVVVVTHRVKSLERFDMVFVMSGGKIVDSGPPQEIQRRSALFKQLLEAG